ncbi:MAG TPA: FecR domain-containing protein [Pseudobacter sp.]|nr:FecR domain-containing protein [Pseudobacter sp.]
MEDKRLRELFTKWTSQSVTPEEELELMSFLSRDSSAAQREALVAALYEANTGELDLDRENAEQIIAAILQQGPQAEEVPVHRMRPFRKWMKYAAVFLGLIIAATITYLILDNKRDASETATAQYVTEPLDPRRATLVLADGESIELQENPDSKFRQEQTEILNIDTSVLKYSASEGLVKPAGYNTLIIPRGGQYKLELADGTEVWLNAATRLRYPAHFGGVTRREIFLESGEAYFKVKKNTALPFIVNVKGMEVQVLGTEFNVNAYTNSLATTLVSGSVRLNAAGLQSMLQPGYQGLLVNGKITTQPVDTEIYTAWKDGQIIFNEVSLEEATNNLSRLYDFDFEFSSPELKLRKVGGRLRKEAHIEDVLALIEQPAYVKFNIKGKTILVSQVMSK